MSNSQSLFSSSSDGVWMRTAYVRVICGQGASEMCYKLLLSRVENSSFVWFICLVREEIFMPLILFFILFFSGRLTIFALLLLFPFTFQPPKESALFRVPSSFRNIASPSCHREPLTRLCPFSAVSALIYQKYFSVFSHLQWILSFWEEFRWIVALSFPMSSSSAVFPNPPSLSPICLQSLRDGAGETWHWPFFPPVFGILLYFYIVLYFVSLSCTVFTFVLIGNLKFIVFFGFWLCRCSGFICYTEWGMPRWSGR